MKTIHKYLLKDITQIKLTPDAKIVLFEYQNGQFTLWAEVYKEDYRVFPPCQFHIFGTGFDIPDGYIHIASFITDDGMFVWHLYEAMI